MEGTELYFILHVAWAAIAELGYRRQKKPPILTCEPPLGHLGHQTALQWEVVTNEGSHPS